MADQTTTIPKGWKMTILGEVAEIKGGKRLPMGKTLVTQRTEHPYIRITDIENNKIKKSQLQFVTDDVFSSISRYIVNSGDVIVSIVGSIGFVAQIDDDLDKASLTENCVKFVNLKNLESRFLYYFLTSKSGQNEIERNTVGAVQKKLPIYGVQNIQFFLPQLPEQQAIAAVLSSLDDKIELLREQNKTLEATAQAIFKEWFVNFNFPGATGKMIDSEIGEIPEGWRVGEIKDLCKKLASGGTPATIKKDYYDGDIDWFSTKELQDNFIFESDKKITKTGLESSSAKVFPKGSVVMAIYAAPTVGRLGILGKEATFNQAACGFVANEEIASNEYIYLLLLSLRDDFNRLANGAAQQNLNVGLVKNFTIIIPDKIIMTQFKAIVTPIFGKILNNTSQIQTLSALRDTLLPKLMKGEVRVEGFNDQTL